MGGVLVEEFNRRMVARPVRGKLREKGLQERRRANETRRSPVSLKNVRDKGLEERGD